MQQMAESEGKRTLSESAPSTLAETLSLLIAGSRSGRGDRKTNLADDGAHTQCQYGASCFFLKHGKNENDRRRLTTGIKVSCTGAYEGEEDRMQAEECAIRETFAASFR